MGFFSSNIASREIFRQLSASDITVFCGEDSIEKLTSNYNGKLSWTVASPEVISFNRSDGSIRGKTPGISAITASDGSKTLYCMVYSVGLWHEPESAYIDETTNIKEFPSSVKSTISTTEEGLVTRALGDISAKHNWLYVEYDGVYGFVPVVDFPGVDYLLTQFHYYDQGFAKRYYEAELKIYEYSDFLNEIMMDLFNLKVNPIVEPFDSTSDRCKIMTYGSVYKNNLAFECPGTGEHYFGSCTELDYIRNDFLSKKGNGNNAIHKCLWTGHKLKGNEPSVANFKSILILYTIRNHVYANTFSNYNMDIVRLRRVCEILHETGHLFGLHDGYCYGQTSVGGKCSNQYCYECNGRTVPDLN